ITGVADSTPSTWRSNSTYFVLRFADDDVNCIDPGRVKMISALTFDERFCKSSDMPCASPVKSITCATPNATQITLIADRNCRCLRFEMTMLSKQASSERAILIQARINA